MIRTGITRQGTNNDWTAGMTGLQRERAAAPFEDAPRRWDFQDIAIKLACWVMVALAAFIAVSV